MVPVLGTGEEGAISWVEVAAEQPAEAEEPDVHPKPAAPRRFGEQKLRWRKRSAVRTIASAMLGLIPR